MLTTVCRMFTTVCRMFTTVCRMFTTMCLRFSQAEIGWGLIIFAARVLQCTDHLFDSAGIPVWVQEGVGADFRRLQRAWHPPLSLSLSLPSA